MEDTMFLMAAMAASSGGTQLLLPQEQVKEEHHHQQQQLLGSPRPGLSVAQVHVPLTVQQTLGDAIEKGNSTMQNSLQAYLDTLGRVSPESAASYEPIRARRRRRRPANTTNSAEKGTSEANQVNSKTVEPRSNVTMQQKTDKGNAKRKSRCPSTTPLRDALNNDDQTPYEQNPTTKRTKLDEGKAGLRYTYQKPQEDKEQLLELQTLPDSVSGQESSPEIPEEAPDALQRNEVHVSFEEFPYKIGQESSHDPTIEWLGFFLESLVDCTVPSAEGMKDPDEDSLLRFFSVTKETSKKPTECTSTFDTHADWSCRLISSVVAGSWLPITH